MNDDTIQLIVCAVGLTIVLAAGQGCQTNEYEHIQAMERIKLACPTPGAAG